MSSEFQIQRVGNILLQNSEGKTLQEMIHELKASKVSVLKWLQLLEKDGLIYKTRLMKLGKKGRPQNVYHSTKKLKKLSGGKMSDFITIEFSKFKGICKFKKGGRCKALLPNIQDCKASACPYLKI